MLNRYFVAAFALGMLLTNQAYAACTSTLITFTNGLTANAVDVNTNFTNTMGCATTPPPLPTRQVLTSGSSATYTTPSNVRQLRIRMVGGGGGGAGSSNDFSAGNGAGGSDTLFNGVHAGGGSGGSEFGSGGPGGTSSTGTASFRVKGSYGGYAHPPLSAINSNEAGFGAASALGGGTMDMVAASANTGAGGGGHDLGAYSVGSPGGGGGSGEYLELIINSPSASYTYTVGAGGSGGSTGTGGGAGYAGGSGLIIVDELY